MFLNVHLPFYFSLYIITILRLLPHRFLQIVHLCTYFFIAHCSSSVAQIYADSSVIACIANFTSSRVENTVASNCTVVQPKSIHVEIQRRLITVLEISSLHREHPTVAACFSQHVRETMRHTHTPSVWL